MQLKAKQFFFVLLGVLALSVVAMFGAYYWGNSQLEAEAASISDLLADRDVSQEKIIRLNKAQQDAQNVEPVNQLLDRLLPTAKEQDKLVADVIFTATSEAGIPFSSVSSFSFSGSAEPDDLSGTEASKEAPGVYIYPFTLSINNITYETLLKLLTEIETNGRIVQVDSVSITPDKDNAAQIDVTLQTRAYLRP